MVLFEIWPQRYVYLRFEIAKCLLTNTDVQKMFKDIETATTF